MCVSVSHTCAIVYCGGRRTVLVLAVHPVWGSLSLMLTAYSRKANSRTSRNPRICLPSFHRMITDMCYLAWLSCGFQEFKSIWAASSLPTELSSQPEFLVLKGLSVKMTTQVPLCLPLGLKKKKLKSNVLEAGLLYILAGVGRNVVSQLFPTVWFPPLEWEDWTTILAILNQFLLLKTEGHYSINKQDLIKNTKWKPTCNRLNAR